MANFFARGRDYKVSIGKQEWVGMLNTGLDTVFSLKTGEA